MLDDDCYEASPILDGGVVALELLLQSLSTPPDCCGFSLEWLELAGQ